MSAYGYGRVEPDMASPRRRIGQGQAPPLLTTSLNNAHNLQHGLGFANNQTPMSATSLSSPFSLNNPSPNSALPAGAASPMAYNPQEWARRDHSDQYPRISPRHGRQDSENTVYAPRQHGPDEPVRSPPPPYSTEPVDASPADSTPSNQFSPAYLPSSASTCMSPACTTAQTSPRNASAPLPPPPPPPPGGPPATVMQGYQHGTQTALDDPRAPALPPGARRAASTGDMHRSQPVRSPLGLHSETPSQARHGFTLPPPPPGPPPKAQRSMSLNRVQETAQYNTSIRPAPKTRRPPALGTELEPVPPTPADWAENSNNNNNDQEGEESQQVHSRGPETLHVRTQGLPGPQVEEEFPASASRSRQDSLGGLVRSPAVRNRSSSALRDRRSASRAGRIQSPDAQSPYGDDPLSHPLENLVLNNGSNGSALADRRRSARYTPRSGGSYQGLDAALGSSRSLPQSARSLGKPPLSSRSHAVGSTAGHDGMADDSATPTKAIRGVQQGEGVGSSVPSPAGATQQLRGGPASSGMGSRPISHLLHTPNDDANVKVQPLSPESSHSLMDFENDPDALGPHTEDLFIAQSVERHRFFIEQEAAAENDVEKLNLFVQFILQESRLRRVRYAEVFEEENVQPADLLQGMFTLPPSSPRPASQAISQSSRGPPLSSQNGGDRRGSASSSATSFADSPLERSRASTTATSDQPLKLDTSVADAVRRREGAFVPALSPIASMSAVTGKDEMDSRGRPPSRWWEEGSNSSGRAFDVMGRSKRESKYMSALIEDEHADQVVRADHGGGAASSSCPPPQYDGPGGEYPPEKGALTAQATPTFPSSGASQRAPYDNAPGVLDISHFTTLPPPYPRRHPAVNNSHPELADTRAILRTLNDVGEADTAVKDFEDQTKEKRSRADSWAAHQKSMHEREMQFRISQGDISRQEYDDANFALEDKIFGANKSALKGSFDLYQSLVVTPVHSFLSTRIAIANNTIDTLTNKLLERGGTPLPDQPQSEGDSQPELLEKLTLLKWLFEAREALHKKQFDIISKRNDLYRDVVLQPYNAPGAENNTANTSKKADALNFFHKDFSQREQQATDDSLTRWTMFHDTVRSAVETGVQSQLSAFWDIAPQLQELLQQIPSETGYGKRPERSGRGALDRLEIFIPRNEVEETPAYWQHPLRYLYSVASHAEASTRQFVDAQISLWCLEQEIREGVVRSSRTREEEGDDGGAEERSEVEIRKGVDELKEKVGVVEGQWAEGLGAEFDRVKHAVREHLEASGGWDEELEEQIV